MSTLDINQKSKKLKYFKTLIVYLIISILCMAVNKIYALFGHGVSSDAMTWMFLYPLIGGLLFYLLIKMLIKGISQISGYRAFYNIYNSGIAILTVGSFLKGVLDIAGTSSQYTVLYFEIGWVCIAVSLMLLMIEKSVKHRNRL